MPLVVTNKGLPIGQLSYTCLAMSAAESLGEKRNSFVFPLTKMSRRLIWNTDKNRSEHERRWSNATFIFQKMSHGRVHRCTVVWFNRKERKVVRPWGPSSKGSNLDPSNFLSIFSRPLDRFLIFGTRLCHIMARLHLRTIMIHKPDVSPTLFLFLEMKSHLQFIPSSFLLNHYLKKMKKLNLYKRQNTALGL